MSAKERARLRRRLSIKKIFFDMIYKISKISISESDDMRILSILLIMSKRGLLKLGLCGRGFDFYKEMSSLAKTNPYFGQTRGRASWVTIRRSGFELATRNLEIKDTRALWHGRPAHESRAGRPCHYCRRITPAPTGRGRPLCHCYRRTNRGERPRGRAASCADSPRVSHSRI